MNTEDLLRMYLLRGAKVLLLSAILTIGLYIPGRCFGQEVEADRTYIIDNNLEFRLKLKKSRFTIDDTLEGALVIKNKTNRKKGYGSPTTKILDITFYRYGVYETYKDYNLGGDLVTVIYIPAKKSIKHRFSFKLSTFVTQLESPSKSIEPGLYLMEIFLHRDFVLRKNIIIK